MSWLTEEAGRRGVSVESIAGQLLQRGLEWERCRAGLPTYHDLDALAGTWSEDDAAAFLHAVASPAAEAVSAMRIVRLSFLTTRLRSKAYEDLDERHVKLFCPYRDVCVVLSW
jgi:hypothetical protein